MTAKLIDLMPADPRCEDCGEPVGDWWIREGARHFGTEIEPCRVYYRCGCKETRGVFLAPLDAAKEPKP